MVYTLLDGLTHKTRQNIIKHGDRMGRTALHTASLEDKVEVADLVIRSADTEDGDSVIYCIDDDGNTPLDGAKSSDMAQMLLDGLTVKRRQRHIKHRGRRGQTAASEALRGGGRHVFITIWQQCDEST